MAYSIHDRRALYEDGNKYTWLRVLSYLHGDCKTSLRGDNEVSFRMIRSRKFQDIYGADWGSMWSYIEGVTGHTICYNISKVQSQPEQSKR